MISTFPRNPPRDDCYDFNPEAQTPRGSNLGSRSSIAIPPDVARKLGYYVYLLFNPLDEAVFYVGKGQGKRALTHLQDPRRSRKTEVLRQIRAAGLVPRVDIVAHGLPDEAAAFRIEASLIDILGLPALTNEIRGWRTKELGRLPPKDLVALYRKKKVTIKEPDIYQDQAGLLAWNRGVLERCGKCSAALVARLRQPATPTDPRLGERDHANAPHASQWRINTRCETR